MKKFITIAAAIAIIGIGGSTGYAQQSESDDELPIECAEQDRRDQEECDDFYKDTTTTSSSTTTTTSVAQSSSSTTSSTTTTEATTTTTLDESNQAGPTTAPSTTAATPQQGSLPRTGSGASGPLQIGAILLVIGGIAIVATRRRSTATTG